MKKHLAALPAGFTVTAHTGAMGTKENSAESLIAGAESGADIVEFDLNFTSGGSAVMSHDAPVGNEEAAELAFVFLNRRKKLRANIDVKSTLNIKEAELLAEKYSVTDRVFFTGVHDGFVSDVKINCPKISYYLNVNVDKRKKKDPLYIASLIEKVKSAGAVGINFNKAGASKELISAFRAAGLLTSVWTLKSKSEMRKILRMLPDNITTKNPAMLKKLIDKDFT